MKIFKKSIVVIITIAIVTISNICQAQNNTYTLGFVKGTPLTLGSGFSIDNPFEALPYCLVKPYDSVITNGNSTTNFTCSIISNESSLQQAAEASGYLSISDINYSMDASYGTSSSSFYSSSSVTLAISATIDYGSVKITNPTLNSVAQSYLNSNGSSAFINHYGDNFVIQEELGISATVFLTISNLTSIQQSILSGSLSGQVQGIGSADASFTSSVNAANTSGNLQIQVATNGGGTNATNALSSLIAQARANTDAFDSIKNVFSRFMFTFNKTQANVTGFTYAPMRDFFSVTGGNDIPSEKVIKLGKIYDSYWDIVGKANLLNSIINSKYYNDFHNNSDALEATRLANQYQLAEDSLANAHQACLADPCSNMTTCCNNPVFVFNDALINKFLTFPFFSCIDANPNWSFQYANNTFTFTSTKDFTVAACGGVWPGGPCGQNFYYCSTSDSDLVGKIVIIQATGAIYNPGRSGDGIYGSVVVLEVSTNNGTLDPYSMNNCNNSGNTPFLLNTTESVGADGNITLELNAANASSCGGNSNVNLTLRQGATIAISVPNLKPAIDAIITPGDATICQGDSVILTANTCSGCSYLWSTSETTQSISVKTGGNYTVNVSNSSSSNTSYWSTIKVNQPPVIPGITGSLMICQGNSDTLTANSAGCNGCSYTWLPANQTGSILKVTPAVTSTYTVTASNGCSPVATSLPVTLTVNQPPASPTFTVAIVQGQYNLTASRVTGDTYQWYLNDNPISGATSRFYTVDTTGHYSVGITDPNGCSSLSILDTLLIVNSTGLKELSLSRQVSIHPNPTSNSTTLYFNLPEATNVTIGLYNVEGQMIQNIVDNQFTLAGHQQYKINTSMASGIYYVRLKTTNAVISLPVVKVE